MLTYLNFKNISKYTYSLIITSIVIGVVIYSNALYGEFLWDDIHLIVKNPVIQHWEKFLELFVANIGYGIGDASQTHYRPLLMLSFMMDYLVWGLNPFGFHLTNLILHILVTWLSYQFVTIFVLERRIAFLGALLFLVHPLQTDAISYISGRSDPLAAVFILVSFNCFYYFTNSKKSLLLISSLIAYSLALISKENALMLPFALTFFIFLCLKEKKFLKYLTPFYVLLFLYVGLRLFVLNTLSVESAFLNTLFERVPGCFVALVNYFALIVFPVNLHAGYGNILFSWTDPKVFIGVLIIFLFLCFFLSLRKRKSFISFWIVWFFLMLIPVWGLFPIYGYMAEHNLYLPFVGLFSIFAYLINWIYENTSIRKWVFFAFSFLILNWGMATYSQNHVWANPITFFKNSLRFTPNQYQMTFNLGEAYQQRNDFASAEKYYKKAIQLNPKSSAPYNNLGSICLMQKRLKESEYFYQKSVQINPNDATAYHSLGLIYAHQARWRESVEIQLKAIELNDRIADYFNNLGTTYVMSGDPQKAYKAYLRAVELDPSHYLAQDNLKRLAAKYPDTIRE